MHFSSRFSPFPRPLLHLVCAAALLPLGAQEAFAQEEGRIQGRVFIDGTREPVAGALVRADPPIFGPDGSRLQLAEPLETVTDRNGRFALTWMRSGIWNTMVSAEGFEDAMLRIEVTQRGSNACTATKMQQCIQPIEFHMARLKVDAAEEVEAALAGVNVENVDLEQAKADLIAADAAYNRQDFRAAIDGYNRLLARWPQMTALYQDVGDAHRARAEFDAAIAAYERYRAAAPGDDPVERKIARTKLLMGDLAAAEDLAAAGGSASREDLYNLGEVAFGEGDVDAAAGWYEKASAADPGWPPPVFKLGLLALNRGDIEGAKVLFRKVVELDPDSAEGAQAQGILAALP